MLLENNPLFLWVPSISGGKDSQAMMHYLKNNGITAHSVIHCDLGKVEWPESGPFCEKISQDIFNLPVTVLKRKDGLGLLEYWKRRMIKLKGSGKPFWSSAKNRYCTSDLKRGPSDAYFTTLPTDKIIIDCQGIRAEESPARASKSPLSLRKSKCSTYYKGMTAEEAIANFKPGKRLVITYYPIFEKTIEQVYELCGESLATLSIAQSYYKTTGKVPDWWQMHPAYVYGNERVSCRYCILGSINDLRTAKKHDADGLLDDMIKMENEGCCTFKNNFSLQEI